MLLPRPMNLCAPSREGSFTGMAVAGAREGSFTEAARALAALRQQHQPLAVAAGVAKPGAAAPTEPLVPRPPSLRQALFNPEPQPLKQQQQQPMTSPERERLAFLSAAMGNPTIAPDAAAVAVAALAVAPGPSPQPQQQPQQEPQQQPQPQAPLPMSKFYSERSQLQQSAIAVTLPYVFRAAAQHVRFAPAAPSPAAAAAANAAALPSIVRVAEIGCASASNTKAPVQALLAGLAARAHRARRESADGRAARSRQSLLQQKRRLTASSSGGGGGSSLNAAAAAAALGTSPPPVFLTAAGDAGADEDDTAAGDAAAAFPLPAQVDLRLVDLPTNDWSAVALAAGRLTAELARRTTGNGDDEDAAAIDDAEAVAAADEDDEDEDAEVLNSDDDGSVVSAVGPDFDDDALAAGGPRLPPAPPARVFPSIAPVSMYEPSGVAPEASQHLIYSNTCAHWQPGQHATIPAGSSASAFVSLAKALRAQAQALAARDGGRLHAALESWRLGARGALADWLRLRAKELADGGVLVFTMPCADEEAGGLGVSGDDKGDAATAAEDAAPADDDEEEANSFATWLAPLVGGAVRDLLREGAITPDEAEALTAPGCPLPTEDVREVLREFSSSSSLAAGGSGGGGAGGASGGGGPVFEVLEMSKEVLPPHPAWYHYRTGAITPLALGHAYAEWAAAVSEPFFVAQLAPRLAARGVAPAGPAAREAAGAVVARLFRRVAERVAKDPRPLRYLPVVVTLRRVPRGGGAVVEAAPADKPVTAAR